MTIVGNEPTISAGMKRWDGGDSAPADWDGGSVLWADGDIAGPATLSAKAWKGAPIIAYTPRAPGEARDEVASLADQFAALHNGAKGCEFDLTPADGPIARLTLFVHQHGDAILAALHPSARDGECERLTNALIGKADQCDRLAEVSRVPACFEYRAKAVAYREAVSMIRAALFADRSEPAGVVSRG